MNCSSEEYVSIAQEFSIISSLYVKYRAMKSKQRKLLVINSNMSMNLNSEKYTRKKGESHMNGYRKFEYEIDKL